MILSFGPTVRDGESSIFPLTLTRPSAIHRSASRREHSPARAMTLAMRTESIALLKEWRRSVMDFPGVLCPKEIILVGTVRDKWKAHIPTVGLSSCGSQCPRIPFLGSLSQIKPRESVQPSQFPGSVVALFRFSSRVRLAHVRPPPSAEGNSRDAF